MPQSPVPSCFLVVQGKRARAVQMMADLRAARPDATLRYAIDLSQAHDLSQKAHPDLVIMDHDILQEPELAVFISILSALAIDWAMVYEDVPNDRLPARRQVRIDALGSFVSREWHPKLALGCTQAIDQKADRNPRVASMQSKKVHTDVDMPVRAKTQWKPIVMGASTGGINALIEVLSHFPANAPPTLIVQHIKGYFIPGLAERLNRLCAPSVRAAQSHDRLVPGSILLAPGNTRHMVISQDGRRCQFEDGPPQTGHRPSIDRLFSSAAVVLGAKGVGIILSGMGRDGASGLLEMRKRGAWTIGQDQDSCTVYGMPRAAAKAGALSEELPLSQIGPAALKAAALPQQIASQQRNVDTDADAHSRKKTHDA
ncbi:MAG: CheB methylesterase domain-containing protein [Pseudomonadota bacterium]